MGKKPPVSLSKYLLVCGALLAAFGVPMAVAGLVMATATGFWWAFWFPIGVSLVGGLSWLVGLAMTFRTVCLRSEGPVKRVVLAHARVAKAGRRPR
jgi:hypothetical protein